MESTPSVGITAFIDILGFGSRVLAAESAADIESIRKSVELIRKTFDHNTGEDLALSNQKLVGAEILAFSDSVIVNIPLESEATKYSGTFDPIMSEIAGFALAQGECVLNGTFLRGGIDLGWWYRDDEIVISQSLTRAYKQESECHYPVISITDSLAEFLETHKDRQIYSQDIDPTRSIFAETQFASKSITFIDYIRICLNSLDWMIDKAQINEHRSATPEEKQRIVSEGYRKKVDAWLTTHATRIREAHEHAPDQVKAKYQWLQDYHNRMAKQYSDNVACICELS